MLDNVALDGKYTWWHLHTASNDHIVIIIVSARYECGTEQEMTAIHALTTPLPCFAVGICRYRPGEVEPTNGQLLIFSMNTKKNIHLKPSGSAEVHGCIFAFANIGEMLAIAVNSSVSSVKHLPAGRS